MLTTPQSLCVDDNIEEFKWSTCVAVRRPESSLVLLFKGRGVLTEDAPVGELDKDRKGNLVYPKSFEKDL